MGHCLREGARGRVGGRKKGKWGGGEERGVSVGGVLPRYLRL